MTDTEELRRKKHQHWLERKRRIKEDPEYAEKFWASRRASLEKAKAAGKAYATPSRNYKRNYKPEYWADYKARRMERDSEFKEKVLAGIAKKEAAARKREEAERKRIERAEKSAERVDQAPKPAAPTHKKPGRIVALCRWMGGRSYVSSL